MSNQRKYRNLGQSWYHTTTNKKGKTSRWRYSRVIHIVANEEESEAYCGIPLHMAARAYSEEAIRDRGIGYYTSSSLRFCKKCQRHPNYGLLLLRTI